MATNEEMLKWEEYHERFRRLISEGFKNGLVRLYDDKLLERLRGIYYGGVPASILILHERLSNGHCYDRASLITLGFGDDDFNLVYADVNSIRLNPEFIDAYKAGKLGADYGDHCFAERTLEDGSVWVYDTSLGLVVEKSLYYEMEKPKVRLINDRNSTLDFMQDTVLDDMDIERDKYALPLILPCIERNMTAIQDFYLDQLQEEIRLLKEEVDYGELCSEIDEDMKVKGFKRH